MKNDSSPVSYGPLFGVRIPEGLGRRVESIRQQLQDKSPYTKVTRSDALRELLVRGADVLEDHNAAP